MICGGRQPRVETWLTATRSAAHADGSISTIKSPACRLSVFLAYTALHTGKSEHTAPTLDKGNCNSAMTGHTPHDAPVRQRKMWCRLTRAQHM